jgi:hypothetical protein
MDEFNRKRLVMGRGSIIFTESGEEMWPIEGIVSQPRGI